MVSYPIFDLYEWGNELQETALHKDFSVWCDHAPLERVKELYRLVRPFEWLMKLRVIVNFFNSSEPRASRGWQTVSMAAGSE